MSWQEELQLGIAWLNWRFKQCLKQLQLLKLSRDGGFWIMTEREGQELISETASSFRDGAFRFVHGCQGPGYPMEEQVAKAELVLDRTPLPPALQKKLPGLAAFVSFCFALFFLFREGFREK